MKKKDINTGKYEPHGVKLIIKKIPSKKGKTPTRDKKYCSSSMLRI